MVHSTETKRSWRTCEAEGVGQATDHEAGAAANDGLRRQLCSDRQHHVRVVLVAAPHIHTCASLKPQLLLVGLMSMHHTALRLAYQ